MAIPVATLGGTNLPLQFRYSPYTARKRNTVTPTAGAVITQHAPNQIIHGDGTLPWRVDAATPLEFKTLWDLYNEAIPTLLTFVGYWGETLEVFFSVFDQPSIEGRLFNLSGQFQVIDVTVDYNPSCGF